MKTQEAVTALSALAQESRLEVFRILVEVGHEGLAAGEIAERLEIQPATLSFHLRTLSHAHLLHSERDGRTIRYTANYETMTALVGFLTDNCCHGNPESCLPAKTSSRSGKKSGKR